MKRMYLAILAGMALGVGLVAAQNSPVPANKALIIVQVPHADASVKVDGFVSSQRGLERQFFTPELTAELCAATGAQPGDAIFFAADTEDNVCKFLARLREEVARRRKLIPDGLWNFLWVIDFPMFEKNKETGKWVAMHHPFTAPLDEDLHMLRRRLRREIEKAETLTCGI